MRWPAWLGVGERRWKKSPNEEVQPPKTAWDFLQLLIVPAILVVIALAFNASQASRDRSREDRRIREDRALADAARKDGILDAYLAKMSGLILDRDLTRAKEVSPVGQVARTATLTTLRRLDGSRKGEVVRFLREAGLLNIRKRTDFPVINLGGADLRGVDLTEAALVAPPPRRVLLVGDLRSAKFDDAVLYGVDFFRGVKLQGASFNGAFITERSSLSSLDLRGVSFKEAYLDGVDFSSSDLRGAVFDKAEIFGGKFDETCLNNASFVGATFNHYRSGLDYGETPFLRAKGEDVDFSDAVNLSSVRLSLGVTDVNFDGAKERPTRTPRALPSDEVSCAAGP
jgi:uncharacterized protein YjbI with pentapeptide repeats